MLAGHTPHPFPDLVNHHESSPNDRMEGVTRFHRLLHVLSIQSESINLVLYALSCIVIQLSKHAKHPGGCSININVSM
jgi:hypothetical protein